MGFIWLDFHPEVGAGILSWPFSLAILALLIYFVYLIIAVRFYGQGDLILSPEGFEIRTLYGKSPCKYCWTDVTGFYVAMVPLRRNIADSYEAACFDKVNWTTNARRQVLPYPMNNHELVALMNEWKAKYAPNPEGIVHDPVPSDPIKQYSSAHNFISIGIVLVFTLGLIAFFVFAGCSLWNSVTIRVINNTHTPVTGLDIKAYATDLKKMFPFYLAALDIDREAPMMLSHTKRGSIRVQYWNQEGKKICKYVSHALCPWTRQDSIYLEPNGKIIFAIPFCRDADTKKLDEAQVSSCPEQDSKLAMQNYHEEFFQDFTMSKKPKMTSGVSTRVGLQALTMEVSRHWHPPATERHLQALVHFELLENATIQNVIMLKSSENQLWDQRALDAVHDASPEKMMPENKSLLPASVNFNFEYPPH